MNRRTVDSQLAPLVNAAAYDLLAEGRNPTVRAIRERVRASNNDVTAALAVWRQGLKAQLDAGLAEHGIPSHVASYVRLGIRAAEQLRAMGFTSVRPLCGGTQAWLQLSSQGT